MISKALCSLVLALAFIPGLFGQSPTGFDPSTFSPLKTIEGTAVAALIGMTDEELEKIAIVRDKWQEAIGDFLKLDEKEQSAQRPQLRKALQEAEANVFVILGDSKGKMLLRCHRIEFFRLTALELLRTENFKKEMDCSEEQTTEIERVYAKWLKLTVQKLS